MVPEFVVPLPGVKPTLEALRERGIAVAVLSNGWNPLQPVRPNRPALRDRCWSAARSAGKSPRRRPSKNFCVPWGLMPHRLGTSATIRDATWQARKRSGCRRCGSIGSEKSIRPTLRPPEHTIREFQELLKLVARAGARDVRRLRSSQMRLHAARRRRIGALELRPKADRSRSQLHDVVVRAESDQRDRCRHSHLRHQLADYSAAAQAAQMVRLRAYRNQLAALLPPAGASAHDRVDYLLVRADLEGDWWARTVLRSLQRNPSVTKASAATASFRS